MNPSPESVQYADYILNHYSKDSYSDKICLARSLEQNGWKKTSAVKSNTPRTDSLLDNQKFDNVDFDTSCQQLAELCRELERELNEVSYERDKAWEEYWGMKEARDQLRDKMLDEWYENKDRDSD